MLPLVQQPHLHFSQIVKRQWPLLLGAIAACLAISAAVLYATPPQYKRQTYIDTPYANELVQLNHGRSQDSSLLPYTPEQVYAYFTRRLASDSAMQRFFKETYLPAQPQQATSVAEEQELFAQMQNRVLRVIPPPPKGRMLYSIEVTAPQGSDAAQWTQAFLTQVEQDAKKTLLNDVKQSIAVQIHNQERDWQERLQTVGTMRQDRLAQLAEALQIAKAVGQHEPQITRAQPPRQDGLTPYIDGSQLFARGTKSLQAEMDVLAHRKDDAPFVDGLRAAEAKLNFLKEFQSAERDFTLHHVDGRIAAPEQPSSPKPMLIVLAGLLVGACLGSLLALWREGLLQRWLRDDSEEHSFPSLAPAKLATASAPPVTEQASSRRATISREEASL